MHYNQLIIFYFSGTGNAKNAAIWIANIANKKGINCHLINIDRFKPTNYPEITENTLVGFCSPTHGFNLPPIMLKFIAKLPRVKNIDAFVLNTRAGLKLHKLFIPGLSGLAQLFPALILRLKGYRIIGMQPLDLPSNWIFLHPGLKPKVVESIYARCNKIVNRFATNMLNGEKKYKALLSLPLDIAVIPIGLGYYFIGRFFLTKTMVATNACNNCNICISKCPVEAIKTINNKPFWTYKCESCMRCINLCPQRAIETIHGFATLLMVISSMVISPLLIAGLKSFGLLDFFYQSVFTKNIWSLIDAFFFLVFVFISYRLLHFLKRFQFVDRLIAYTSLSKYKFWRRYKSPANGSITVIKNINNSSPQNQ